MLNTVIDHPEFPIERSSRSVLTGFALLGLAWLGCGGGDTIDK